MEIPGSDGPSGHENQTARFGLQLKKLASRRLIRLSDGYKTAMPMPPRPRVPRCLPKTRCKTTRGKLQFFPPLCIFAIMI